MDDTNDNKIVGFHPAIEFALSLAAIPMLAIAYVGAWVFVLLMFFGLSMRLME